MTTEEKRRSKMEKLNSLWVCFVVLAVAYAGKDEETTKINLRESKETVSISVQHTEIERDSDGKFEDERSLKVSLSVDVREGVVTVNKQKAKPNVVIAFHMHTEIDTIGKNAKVLHHSKVPIIVRVLVLEQKLSKGQLTISQLRVQAEIIEVNKRKVEQIKVQEIVMELDNNKNEVLAKRTVVTLSVSEAEIRKRPRERDDHVHCHRKGGRLPESPYRMPKDDMDKPRLPDHAYHGEEELRSKLHKKHHHKKSFCSGFHKLPFGARLAIFITVAAVGLAILMCCVHVFCCKQPRKSQKYDLTQFKDSFDTELDDEAPPLEQKKPLDEQKLVITA